jgi:PiT family inorganic phosphate transporter
MTLLIVIIVLALIFDYINGFHDAANSIATIVSTKVLTPFQAVVWAAFFNFAAFFVSKYIIGEFGIGNTVAKTVVKEYTQQNVAMFVVLAGLLAAIVWNLLTWWYGIPSSSSHTLIGGFGGAALACWGIASVNFQVVGKVVAFIFLAPLVGMTLAYIITIIILNVCRNVRPFKADKWFRRLQLVSSAAFSLGHGGNDAQKVMGIIGAAMVAAGLIGDVKEVPNWVPLACFTAIGLGTLSGGWKIVKTMGTKITKVTPLEGVAAETAGAVTLFLTEWLKIPVSTTHTITGAIIGVGATKRLSAVRWGVTLNLLTAWILTIPVSATMGALAFLTMRLLGFC